MATLVDILLCILAIILPPLPVLIKRGCGINLLINILLCIFGLWIGGSLPLLSSLLSHSLLSCSVLPQVSSTLSTSSASLRERPSESCLRVFIPLAAWLHQHMRSLPSTSSSSDKKSNFHSYASLKIGVSFVLLGGGTAHK
jgi:uncharacterized membrane protein YqaE (UPF0057 family)